MIHSTRIVGSVALVALASLSLAACGGSEDTLSDPSAETTAAMLEQTNGGLTTTDEAPDFNDTNFATLPAFAATGSDAIVDDTGSFQGDAVPAAQRRVYRVMILWGHLPRPADGSAAVAPAAPASRIDWTGSVSVDAGRVSVRRSIGFEAGDSIAARTNPASVSFVSHTQPFVDGLALTVRTDASTPVLHFNTAAGNFDLALPDADGDVHRLADGRNGVYYAAYEERSDCGQGFVFGHWGRLRANLGVFRGHVINEVGAPRGSVRGIWGANRAGAHVFYGKHISNTGTFNGLLGGTFDGGHFTGAWGLRDGSRGELHGRYGDGVERADGRGVFLGRWSERCPAR